MVACCDDGPSPSELRHRISIEALTLVATDTGGQTQSYVAYATVWAKITPKNVKELNFAQRIEPRVDHEIWIRYQSALKASDRIIFGSRVFEIKSIIIPNEIKEWQKILATERTGT